MTRRDVGGDWDVNRRRRALLSTVAGGLLAGCATTARSDGGGRLPVGPESGAGDDGDAGASPDGDRERELATVPAPLPVDFVVFPSVAADAPGEPAGHSATPVTVLRRGVEDPVFEGPAGAGIQYAVDAGRAGGVGAVVALASGTFTVERPVTLASSTWLAGSGRATTLRAAPGLNADLLTVPPETAHVRVSDLAIDGTRAQNDRGSGLVVIGDGWRPVIEHLVVRDVADHGLRFTGGPDGAYTYEPTLADVDVARCGGDGYVVGHVGDLFATNLYAEGCAGYGFTLADAGGTLVHPHAYDTRGEAGIRVTTDGRDLAVIGAHAEGNRRHGLLVKGERVAVRSAFVANNSRDAPGSYSGLVLDGARDCLVVDSTFLNDTERAGGPTQRHGVVETGGARDNVVRDCLFRAHTARPVARADRETGSRFVRNRGYRTRAEGAATVADGDRIAHGLAESPRTVRVDAHEPGTYAQAIETDASEVVVAVWRVRDGRPVRDPVAVSWWAAAE